MVLRGEIRCLLLSRRALHGDCKSGCRILSDESAEINACMVRRTPVQLLARVVGRVDAAEELPAMAAAFLAAAKVS